MSVCDVPLGSSWALTWNMCVASSSRSSILRVDSWPVDGLILMGQSLSKMEYLNRETGDQCNSLRAAWVTLVVIFESLHRIVPYALAGFVRISGCDCSDVAHHTFFHHSEGVNELGEDWRLIHIQHLDVYLSGQIKSLMLSFDLFAHIWSTLTI